MLDGIYDVLLIAQMFIPILILINYNKLSRKKIIYWTIIMELIFVSKIVVKNILEEPIILDIIFLVVCLVIMLKILEEIIQERKDSKNDVNE